MWPHLLCCHSVGQLAVGVMLLLELRSQACSLLLRRGPCWGSGQLAGIVLFEGLDGGLRKHVAVRLLSCSHAERQLVQEASWQLVQEAL